MTSVKWRRARAYCAVLSAALFAATCGPSEHDRRVIDAWLDCEACMYGERDSVVALGTKGIDLLGKALEGPSVERQNIMRAKFTDAYPAVPIPGLTKNQYVNRLLANYVASYQRRAALALARVGGTGSRTVLDDALAAASSRGYRDDVVRTIRVARQTVGATPFPGTLAPVRVLFGDTVTVTAAQAEPFTGDELALIDDSPFSGADVLTSRARNQFKFLAVGGAGGHTVAVTNVGTTSNAQLAILTISSYLDANDRQMLACTDELCEVNHAPPIPGLPGLAQPYVSFLSLWRIPPRMDTLDLFRIQASAPALPVTAHLDWSDAAANLDLRWVKCSTLDQVGNMDGATSSKPEKSTVSIPPAECWVLLVVMRAGAADRALAQLRVTSP